MKKSVSNNPCRRWLRTTLRALGPIALVAALTGCYRTQDMSIQPKFYHSYRPSSFFADGSSARQLPDGVVPHGGARTDRDYYFGYHLLPDGTKQFIDYFPPEFPKSGPDLEKAIRRGRERYNIYCIVCHGQLGFGDGMIVKRGFPSPPSYHTEHLLHHAPIGHFFDVITNGWGAMFGYAERVSVADRWDIVAYVKVLQLSQDVDPASEAAARQLATEEEQAAALQAGPTGGGK